MEHRDAFPIDRVPGAEGVVMSPRCRVKSSQVSSVQFSSVQFSSNGVPRRPSLPPAQVGRARRGADWYGCGTSGADMVWFILIFCMYFTRIPNESKIHFGIRVRYIKIHVGASFLGIFITIHINYIAFPTPLPEPALTFLSMVVRYVRLGVVRVSLCARVSRVCPGSLVPCPVCVRLPRSPPVLYHPTSMMDDRHDASCVALAAAAHAAAALAAAAHAAAALAAAALDILISHSA